MVCTRLGVDADQQWHVHEGTLASLHAQYVQRGEYGPPHYSQGPWVSASGPRFSFLSLFFASIDLAMLFVRSEDKGSSGS